MTCTPLDIKNGLFLTTSIWESSPSKNFDGKSLTFSASGSNPGILIQQGSNSLFHQQISNHILKYMVLGNKYLLILDIDTGIGPRTRNVTLVNFASWVEVFILSVVASSSVSLPVVQPSQVNGVIFLAYGQNETQHTNVNIRRSDNGDVLCSLGSIIPTGQTLGEATATDLIIHYSTSNVSKQKTCPRPLGECDISPSSQTFTGVEVGGCAFTPPTKQFVIKNIGNDCLTVNAINDSLPFSVQNISQPLPASLAYNEMINITVAFSPTIADNWNDIELHVTTTPANGDDKLVCSGTATNAQPGIQFSDTSFNFGKYPVGTSAPVKTLVISNSGTAPLMVSVPVLSVSGFSCAGYNGTLNCGQSQSVALGFTPTIDGQQSATLNITSNANGSPHSIQLSGEGCIANAEIQVPTNADFNFGQVQQGFRTVRYFEVQNMGDGLLTFQGQISGADALLFGLPDPDGSVVDVQAIRNYTVYPVSSCGGGTTGSGKTKVAVSFFANDSPKIATGTLTLGVHNATNYSSSQTWSFPLTAEIVSPIALDVGLVIDRSGSMNDPLGSRVKIDAAIDAGQLFVELLRPNMDDRVAVVRFNHLPDVVVPITDVSTSNTPTQNQILQMVQNNIPPATGMTAIAGGAMTAINEIQKPRNTTPSQLHKALVVLTDGIENTGFEDPPGSGNWYSILGGWMWHPTTSLPKVITTSMSKPSDIDIYTVGLGRESDIDCDQLVGLASQSANFFHVNQDLTGAMYFNLEQYYTKIFMGIIDTSVILDPMYWIKPGQLHEIDFDVLKGDVDILIVIYDWMGQRLPFYCMSPQGEILDPATIPAGYKLRSGATRQARFVHYKMPLQEPKRYAGGWKVIIEHPGKVCYGMPKRGGEVGFLPNDCKDSKDPVLYGITIGAGSNFRMFPFITPKPVYIGDHILLTALVSEAGLPVIDCNITVEVLSPDGLSWTLTLLDDGIHSDGEADDGEYGRIFTHTYKPGTYHFHFKAVGKNRDGMPVMREAFRDKPVLMSEPPCTTKPGMSDECCRQILEEIREQRLLLERSIKSSRQVRIAKKAVK